MERRRRRRRRRCSGWNVSDDLNFLRIIDVDAQLVLFQVHDLYRFCSFFITAMCNIAFTAALGQNWALGRLLPLHQTCCDISKVCVKFAWQFILTENIMYSMSEKGFRYTLIFLLCKRKPWSDCGPAGRSGGQQETSGFILWEPWIFIVKCHTNLALSVRGTLSRIKVLIKGIFWQLGCQN